MPDKTIKVSTLKVMINSEYARCENLYNVYKLNAGNGRNADYYTARMSTLIDLAAQIEQETGATIFEDAEDFAAEIERETNSKTAVKGA